MLTQNLSIHAKVLTETSQILHRVEQLMEKIPKRFNLEEIASGQNVDDFSSMQIILCQELNSCNKLTDKVTGSLTSLKEALVGLNVMSSDVENTFKHLKKDNVPEDFKVRLIQKY